jgi:hypothetical protein
VDAVAVESSGRLGRYRYVVERSLAWLVGNRRLAGPLRARADVLLGFLYLACALVCLHHLNRADGENRASGEVRRRRR